MERPEELYGKYNTARPSMATGVTALAIAIVGGAIGGWLVAALFSE
jgi:hypothetical protein